MKPQFKFTDIQGNQIRFFITNGYEAILHKSGVDKFALIESINYDDSVLRVNESTFYVVDKAVGKIVYDFLAAKPKVKAYEVKLTTYFSKFVGYIKAEDFEEYAKTCYFQGFYSVKVLRIVDIEEDKCWSNSKNK